MFSSVRTARASAACHRIELHAAALYKVPADRQNGAPSRGNHLRHPAWQFRRHELRRVGCAVAEATCCFCAAGLRRAHCCNVVESTRTCCCVARTQAAARQLALSGSQASKPQRAALAIVGSSQAAATKGRSQPLLLPMCVLRRPGLLESNCHRSGYFCFCSQKWSQSTGERACPPARERERA